MDTKLSQLRSSRAYRALLIVTTVGAFGVATGALTGLNDDEGRQTPVADSGFRISPVSLDELRENADIVVEGKLIKRVGQADVVWGQSSPLGENQVIHDIVLPIATYELQVDRYVVGAGPASQAGASIIPDISYRQIE